jgi:hypothetical protein
MTVIINGTTGIDTVQDDSVDIPTLSATGTPSASTYLRGDNSWATVAGYTNADALTLFNASGSAPVYACRAWVNFNGTGTVAIRASGNVSSITDLNTGAYMVNFTNAMPDANYSVAISTSRAASWLDGGQEFYSPTTSNVRFSNVENNVSTDTSYFTVSIFR